MVPRKVISPQPGRGLEGVVKKAYSKSFHTRSLFASIATGMERSWYDFGTTLVRLWSLWPAKPV